jgi:hypothetical protein
MISSRRLFACAGRVPPLIAPSLFLLFFLITQSQCAENKENTCCIVGTRLGSFFLYFHYKVGLLAMSCDILMSCMLGRQDHICLLVYQMMLASLR